MPGYTIRSSGSTRPGDVFGDTPPHGTRAMLQLAAFACLVAGAVALGHQRTPRVGERAQRAAARRRPKTSCLRVRTSTQSRRCGSRTARPPPDCAVPQLAAAILIAAGHRWALPASYLAGAALVAWILVQLLVMQRYFFLQPVIAALGIAELALARAWQQADPAGRTPRHHRPVLHG